MAKRAQAKATPKPKTSNPSLKLVEFTHGAISEAITASGATKSNKLILAPLDSINVVPGFNLRLTDTPEYIEGIAELKDSILLEGFYESKPLSVFAAEINGKSAIVLIDGHRRLQAAIAAVAEGADFDKLPVVFKKPTATDLDLAVSLHKENASVPLSMLERAVLVQRMLRAGEDDTAIATRLNVTVRHLSDLKVLISAPKAIRDLIRDGRLSASEAVLQLRKEGGGEKLLEAAAKAEEKAKAAATAQQARQDARLTRQSIEDNVADTPKVRMVTIRNTFSVKEGTEFSYEDAAPYMTVIGDEDWFKKSRKATTRVALEDITVEVKIRRPKHEEAENAPGEETVVEAAPRKRAARNGAIVPDDGLDETFEPASDDDEGVPDLRALGVAEQADTDL